MDGHEPMSAQWPHVDLVIPTIGRISLIQTLMAARFQTYGGTRIIVIGDGPQPRARAIFERYAGDSPRAQYHELPTHTGHGNNVKRWWLNHPDCAEAVQFFDDDDWMPPYAIQHKVYPLRRADLTASMCRVIQVWALFTRKQWRMSPLNLEPNVPLTGMMMARTEALRKLGDKNPLCGAPALEAVAEMKKQGWRFAHIDRPLYWQTVLCKENIIESSKGLQGEFSISG